LAQHSSTSTPDSNLLQRALARWENEGGSLPKGSKLSKAWAKGEAPLPKISEAELAALHVRVIALESLVISLLACAPEERLELARQMAPYISPRTGSAPHALTIHAADHILDLINRACRLRSGNNTRSGRPKTVRAATAGGWRRSRR
jgi:hypothetical protein